MSDLQFYPTPKSLAQKAWSLFKNRDFIRVLEPSAGEGHLADEHPWQADRFRGRTPIIDCCEIDITKHPVLRSKGYQVVGLDFLQFGNAAIYSHVCLNPPFQFGAAHVLKAFDSIWEGEIVAIINSQTLLNPHSAERKHLVRIVEEFGSYEIIKGAFSVNEAERKTDVDIALVYLCKTADIQKDIIGDLLHDMTVDMEQGAGLAGDYAPEQAVALPNSFIENSVRTFNTAVAAMRESVRFEARARHYAALIGNTMAVHCGAQGSSKKDYTANWVKGTIAERYDDLKDRSWANLIRSADVISRLSSAAQKRLEAEFDQIKKLEYTVLNVRGFLCGLIESQGDIQQDMICDLFDLIGKYHSDNSVLGIGWASNSKHRTLARKIKKTRFILPGHGTQSWQSSLNWDSERLLSDFDKCWALLDGKLEPEVSLVSVFRNHFDALRSGERVSGTYLSVRYYPSIGTIHFFPTKKYAHLIDRLNRVVGRKRQWLPPVDDMASPAFWSAFDNADKFDKEVTAEVNKHRRHFWDHPYDRLHSQDGHEKAEQQIIEAIAAVYERNGISVETLLENPRPACPQLELLAA